MSAGKSYGLGWRLVFLAGLGLSASGLAVAVPGAAVAAIAWFRLRNGDRFAWKFQWLLLLWAAVSLVTTAVSPLAILSMVLAVIGLFQTAKDAARLQTPNLDEAPRFLDSRFDQPGDWITLTSNASFTQRYLRSPESVLCETVMTTRGDASQAIALLLGPWTWWGQGHSVEFSERPDGATDQILIPVFWYWCHVRMRLLPPVPLADGGWRIPAVLAGSFDGSASFDVHTFPGSDKLTIRGRFHAIVDNVPIFGQDLVTRSHLWAESGVLPFPFPRGTGWLGLRDLLEANLPVRPESPQDLGLHDMICTTWSPRNI